MLDLNCDIVQYSLMSNALQKKYPHSKQTKMYLICQVVFQTCIIFKDSVHITEKCMGTSFYQSERIKFFSLSKGYLCAKGGKKKFLSSFILCECVSVTLQVTENITTISSTLLSTLLSYFVLKLYCEVLISSIQQITKLGIIKVISCKVTIITHASLTQWTI